MLLRGQTNPINACDMARNLGFAAGHAHAKAAGVTDAAWDDGVYDDAIEACEPNGCAADPESDTADAFIAVQDANVDFKKKIVYPSPCMSGQRVSPYRTSEGGERRRWELFLGAFPFRHNAPMRR